MGTEAGTGAMQTHKPSKAGSPSSWERQEESSLRAFGGVTALPHLDFRLPVSRTVTGPTAAGLAPCW